MKSWYIFLILSHRKNDENPEFLQVELILFFSAQIFILLLFFQIQLLHLCFSNLFLMFLYTHVFVVSVHYKTVMRDENGHQVGQKQRLFLLLLQKLRGVPICPLSVWFSIAIQQSNKTYWKYFVTRWLFLFFPCICLEFTVGFSM